MYCIILDGFGLANTVSGADLPFACRAAYGPYATCIVVGLRTSAGVEGRCGNTIKKFRNKVLQSPMPHPICLLYKRSSHVFTTLPVPCSLQLHPQRLMHPQRLPYAQIQHNFLAPSWDRIGPDVSIQSFYLLRTVS